MPPPQYPLAGGRQRAWELTRIACMCQPSGQEKEGRIRKLLQTIPKITTLRQ